jgi:hypothetical protein
MPIRSLIGAMALAAALMADVAGAQAFDDSQYPNLKGQWIRARPPAGVTGQGPFDPTKSWGRAQQAPLTAEYQAKFEESLADMAVGGPGLWPGARCLPPGMPAMMTNFRPMEIIVKPETTWILIDHIHETHRRIFTDGRGWPTEVEPTFDGYSIGRWIDTDGAGRYDLLDVETRHLKGPRTFEPSGMPLHTDNQTVVKERFFLDQENPNLLHDEMTVIDSALTRPWTVVKRYRREPAPRPDWPEDICAEGQVMIHIRDQTYWLSGDRKLMPAKKGQAPPDLRYFKQTSK